MLRAFIVGSLALVFGNATLAADQAGVEPITAQLVQISPHVASIEEREQLRTMLGRSLREQIAAANRTSSDAWATIQSREDWERFRLEKAAALRKALGTLPVRPASPRTVVTGRILGEGFQIHNLVYESRPGIVVSANLYVPNPPREKMPGILLSHSHHNPKHEGELQDMGMTWARAGCYVLVPDHLGHGERRQHPFVTAEDFNGSFQVGRQDYYFRYDTSLQLYLCGETLMGWMAHDLMTGVDQLLAQPQIDAQKIILLGSVAAGGDSAAVTAALDERIACVCPFNFGGPQPETKYPLPTDAETSFNYAGSGSWESTRNLIHSAKDGFLPWVIVGSVAPRRVIHAHEFGWDRKRDPVWKRYERIWNLNNVSEHLAFAHGHGTITGQDPPGSHCNNLGAVHRQQIHETIRPWFAIDVKPEDEYKNRRTKEELTCLTDEARRQLAPGRLHEVLAKLVDPQLAAARQASAAATPEMRRAMMRESWTRLLGDVGPPKKVQVRDGAPPTEDAEDLTIRRELLDVEPGITLPMLVISSLKGNAVGRAPLVVRIAPDGIAGMLRRSPGEIGASLREGKTVALVEIRGTGASSPGTDQGQQGAITSNSATELMLGRTLLGEQLRDLRAAWRHLAARPQIDRVRMSVVGDSPVVPLPEQPVFSYPRRIDGRPPECWPQGALLAMLLALLEDDVSTVEGVGGLVSFRSVLDSQFVQVPHLCVAPGLLRTCDTPDLIAALAPREVTLSQLVDGTGRVVSAGDARRANEVAVRAYTAAGARDKLILNEP